MKKRNDPGGGILSGKTIRYEGKTLDLLDFLLHGEEAKEEPASGKAAPKLREDPQASPGFSESDFLDPDGWDPQRFHGRGVEPALPDHRRRKKEPVPGPYAADREERKTASDAGPAEQSSAYVNAGEQPSAPGASGEQPLSSDSVSAEEQPSDSAAPILWDRAPVKAELRPAGKGGSLPWAVEEQDGTRRAITRYLSAEQSVPLRTGGIGLRIRCVLGDKETTLCKDEKGNWFLEIPEAE